MKGTVGTPIDNALAETTIGPLQTETVRKGLTLSAAASTGWLADVELPTPRTGSIGG